MGGWGATGDIVAAGATMVPAPAASASFFTSSSLGFFGTWFTSIAPRLMAVRNRQSAILAEGSGSDPDARGRLTTFVLRPVDHAGDRLNKWAIGSHRD